MNTVGGLISERERVLTLGPERAALRHAMMAYIQHLAGVTDKAWTLQQAAETLAREEAEVVRLIGALPKIGG